MDIRSPIGRSLISSHHRAPYIAAQGPGTRCFVPAPRKFGTEQGPLAIKDFEIGCCAASIAHERYVHRFLQIFYGLLLALAEHVVFVIANQRIRDIAYAR